MADSTLAYQSPSAPDKYLDTEQVVVGGTPVERERVQLSGTGATEIVAVTSTAPAGTEMGVVTRNVPSGTQTVRELVTAGKIVPASMAAVAAGGQATLDSDQISTGKTGKLVEIVVTASVPFKVVVQTVLEGVATDRMVWISQISGWDWTPPVRNLITVAQSAGVGFDGFRAVVTNLDPTESADLYATFCYDEEPT